MKPKKGRRTYRDSLLFFLGQSAVLRAVAVCLHGKPCSTLWEIPVGSNWTHFLDLPHFTIKPKRKSFNACAPILSIIKFILYFILNCEVSLFDALLTRRDKPKLCSRHSAVGLVGLFVCAIILQIPFVCVTRSTWEPRTAILKVEARLDTFIWRLHMEQWKGGSRWCQAHTALWVDLLHWGPDERFLSFAEEPNKAIFRCLPRPWNKAQKIAVVNSFSSMWLEINSALAAEGTAPITVASPTWSLHQDER